MNICFIYYSIFSLGGIQRCVTELSNYLVERGYEISIICTNSNTSIDRKKYNLDERVNVIVLKKNSILKKVIMKLIKYINNIFGIFNNEKVLGWAYSIYNREIEEIIRKRKFDVVVGCGAYHNVAVSLLKNVECVKIGWQHHCYDMYFNTKNRNFYRQDKIVKKMFENLDKYVVLTDADRQKMLKYEKDKIIRIYNPVGFKQEKKSSLENKKFLALGRLSEEKGFDILINNFKEFNKQNKEWTLDIYGEGPKRKQLEEQVKNLNLGDYIRIMHRTNDVKEKYKEASVYCMSSYSEGLPMVILEAMESGLPVIVYDLPCVKEVFNNNEEGIIIEDRNDEEYVKAMLELANDLSKRKEFAKNAINRAKDFSIENIGKQWEDFLYMTINKKEGIE